MRYVCFNASSIDYRTAVSGIEPHHIHGPSAVDFKLVGLTDTLTRLHMLIFVCHDLYCLVPN
jgi:hypothetical protein